MTDPIFIVGLPRSGSTLWHNIITRNPGIFRIGEMLFLTPWRKDFRYFIRKHMGDLTIKRNVEKMIDLIFSDEKIQGISASFWRNEIGIVNEPDLKKKLVRKILESDKSLGSIFKILVEEITVFSGYNRCCVKFPVYVNHIPELIQWYPECKIIHIIRDPRAMAMSRTNDPGGTSLKVKKYPSMSFILRKTMIFFSTSQYIWTSKLHRKFKKNKNYILFRYEDLLVDPERVIRELCAFTEIDFVPEMLKPQKGNEKGQISSLTGKRHQGFDKKAATRWTEVISPFDRKVISLLTKGSMKRLEYDPNKYL